MTYIQRLSYIAAILVAGSFVDARAGQATVDTSVDQERMRVEGQAVKKYTFKLETTRNKLYCQARVSLEFMQRNAVAKVTGIIENDDCGASSGDYAISVRYRAEDGEVHDIEHPERWRRDNDKAFTFEHEYQIGDNVDLIRVRARKVQCVCTEIPAAAEDELKEGENE